MRLAFATMLVLALGSSAAMAETDVKLHAAGSLKAAMTDIADAFEQAHDIEVIRAFGPSGLLRERIEGGEAAQVYASANMRHPQTLAAAGMAGPVALFAGNRLCALAQPGVDIATETVLTVLVDEGTRLGTSTPGADPSGDYAWELFAKAEALQAGARQLLEDKALQLTGGPDSAAPPEGRNLYAWVMDEDRADVFLTYCTNAVLAQRELPALQIVHLPAALSVGADYGLTLIDGAPAEAASLALFVLSPDAQRILADYGFDAPGLPAASAGD